ncbi:MAG TPA: (2Fe-2S)-binding protein [Aminobacterium sp.]|jgi:NAD(P)H-nitrite reductase large subunit|uniref:(2Fe-2S)-binding protein n=1 Tax=Aminobacterium TaxID=81466 RepID=UPI000463F12F|nr:MULTISPECIES: (2Fe-2S)-binding protein [Aminobacterium]HCA40366.1 (2Fe-2S)-binding protein [Aminobacterium sp.]
MNWKEAHQETTVCYCKNVNKQQILRAITNGAKTLQDIQSMTGACTGNQCATLNPSGICCSKDINELLAIYIPIFEKLSSGNCG